MGAMFATLSGIDIIFGAGTLDSYLASSNKKLAISGQMLGGYWIGNNTPSILEVSPKSLLLIGVGLGLFVGYVVGVARGIMRVINVTQKENVFLPTGKLKFDKSKN
jgi:predicted esterase YcpF (UPF0227 family)